MKINTVYVIYFIHVVINTFRSSNTLGPCELAHELQHIEELTYNQDILGKNPGKASIVHCYMTPFLSFTYAFIYFSRFKFIKINIIYY